MPLVLSLPLMLCQVHPLHASAPAHLSKGDALGTRQTPHHAHAGAMPEKLTAALPTSRGADVLHPPRKDAAHSAARREFHTEGHAQRNSTRLPAKKSGGEASADESASVGQSTLIPLLVVSLVCMVYGARKILSCECSTVGLLSLQDGGFLFAALALNSLVAPMVKVTQNGHGGYDFNQNCIYFFAELVKFLAAAVWCTFYLCLGDDTYSFASIERHDVLQYAVPGFVFFVQNNLSFVALQHMSSAVFQLLLNLRIMAIALLTVAVLGKRLNQIEWAAITLLMLGAVQYQLSSCSAVAMRVSSMGMSVMAVIVACAALGNIYTQKVMQKKMHQPLMLQNLLLYGWGILFNGINWAQSVSNQPAIGQLSFWPCASILFNAVYGLTISVIIKQFGAVTRTFINTAAICVTAILDVALLGEHITLLEATTFGTILIAIYLYSIPAPEFARLQAIAQKTSDEEQPIVKTT
ncbi:hypothetical protein AB1Y20_005399 [Prymnesium parvum]|uniref:Sugar phosphate transporter domain-containing protein n=1 Tax=Prymnesium parvum TaxID=97485 RepID=A0AB34J4J0_PRYPA